VPASCHPSFRHRHIGLALAIVTWLSAGLGGCSRTGLDANGFDDWDDAGIDAPTAADAGQEAIVPRSDAARDSPATSEAASDPRCMPALETCNGIDDDCNGQVDDGIAPIPCPAGGYRYCVGGRSSACPTRCEVCVPGSQRVCFISYCLYWGTQTCAADGRGFGPCREQRPPAECDATARAHGASPELERCCIDQGYCCLDAYDLDNDGNRGEVIGSCGSVSCQP
jgi:hypothetical protein